MADACLASLVADECAWCGIEHSTAIPIRPSPLAPANHSAALKDTLLLPHLTGATATLAGSSAAGPSTRFRHGSLLDAPVPRVPSGATTCFSARGRVVDPPRVALDATRLVAHSCAGMEGSRAPRGQPAPSSPGDASDGYCRTRGDPQVADQGTDFPGPLCPMRRQRPLRSRAVAHVGETGAPSARVPTSWLVAPRVDSSCLVSAELVFPNT